MTKIEPLEYRELLAPYRIFPSGRHVDNLLMPDEIPLHPSVYKSDFAYTQKFVDEVRETVSESMKKDILIIEEVLGEKINYEIDDIGILYRASDIFESDDRYDCKFEDFTATGEDMVVCVEAGCSNIIMESPQLKHEHDYDRLSGSRMLFNYPMPIEKLKQYAVDWNDKYPICNAWYRHNLAMPYSLYLRNFAIMFNNIGLDKL